MRGSREQADLSTLVVATLSVSASLLVGAVVVTTTAAPAPLVLAVVLVAGVVVGKVLIDVFVEEDTDD